MGDTKPEDLHRFLCKDDKVQLAAIEKDRVAMTKADEERAAKRKEDNAALKNLNNSEASKLFEQNKQAKAFNKAWVKPTVLVDSGFNAMVSSDISGSASASKQQQVQLGAATPPLVTDVDNYPSTCKKPVVDGAARDICERATRGDRAYKVLQALLLENTPTNELNMLTTVAGIIPITRHDMATLAPRKWLNDQVIDAYLLILGHQTEADIEIFSVGFHKGLVQQGIEAWCTTQGKKEISFPCARYGSPSTSRIPIGLWFMYP